jgi:hypothetical protein
MPGGSILLVGARSWWRSDGPDRNAVIYGADGRVLAEETLGDGIEHVLADGTGHIWVGYFDEGVFGNYGWGRPGSPEPLGACGLTGFPQISSPSGWRNDIRGVRALAVRGTQAALYGGHGPDRDRLAVGLLDGGRFRQTGEYRLVLPGGEPMPAPAKVIGRGACLHVLTGDGWYQLAMNDLPSGAAAAADRASPA